MCELVKLITLVIVTRFNQSQRLFCHAAGLFRSDQSGGVPPPVGLDNRRDFLCSVSCRRLPRVRLLPQEVRPYSRGLSGWPPVLLCHVPGGYRDPPALWHVHHPLLLSCAGDCASPSQDSSRRLGVAGILACPFWFAGWRRRLPSVPVCPSVLIVLRR